MNPLPTGPDPSEVSRLRILIVSAYLPALGKHGGAGRVFQLLKRVSRKHSVSVISFIDDQRDRENVSRLAPFCRRVEVVQRQESHPVSPFPYEPFQGFHSPKFRSRLEALLDEETFDIVHYEWTQMAQYADLSPNLPKVVTEVEVNYAGHFSLVAVEESLLGKVWRIYNTLQTLYRELELCRQADLVVCVAESDRRYLEGYIPHFRLAVINTGVDNAFFAPGEGALPDPDAVVFVGAFSHYPNVDAARFFCREIFPQILKERPQTRLYLVGDSPGREVLTLGEHPQVIVTGHVEDIRPFYQKAQVVVVPLRTGVGIRGKILEAWAAEKATVATTVACAGIRAAHAENILIADRPGEFAAHTLALLSDSELGRRLGAEGRRTTRQFYDWDRIGDQMIRAYESLAEKHPPTSLERGRRGPPARPRILRSWVPRSNRARRFLKGILVLPRFGYLILWAGWMTVARRAATRRRRSAESSLR